jgi:hypothetical protein
MIEIYEANNEFDFSLWKLRYPLHLPGGQSFCKLTSGPDRKPLYLETPICLTKNGFIRTAKKMSCDLIFTVLEHADFLAWTDSLVDCLQSEILNHSTLAPEQPEDGLNKGHDIWFQNDFGEDDIDDVFIPILKTSSGGRTFSMRINVPLSAIQGSKHMQPAIKVYDENENDVPIDTITSSTKVVAILEVKGIKCNTHSFVLDIIMKQMMIINPSSALDTDCILSSKSNSHKRNHSREFADQTTGGQSLLDVSPMLHSETGLDETETDLPETDLPETDLPETDLPETDLPETDLAETGLDERSLDAGPLKTSFSEHTEIFQVPSREESIQEQSHLPDVVCSDEDEDDVYVEPIIIRDNDVNIEDMEIEDLDMGIGRASPDSWVPAREPIEDIVIENSNFGIHLDDSILQSSQTAKRLMDASLEIEDPTHGLQENAKHSTGERSLPIRNIKQSFSGSNSSENMRHPQMEIFSPLAKSGIRPMDPKVNQRQSNVLGKYFVNNNIKPITKLIKKKSATQTNLQSPSNDIGFDTGFDLGIIDL